MFRGVRCRERIALKPTTANLKRAENHRAAIVYAISTGAFDYRTTFPDSPRALQFAARKGEVETVADYLERWLDDQKKHVKTSTYNGYRKIVLHQLIPWFGKNRLAELRRRTIKEKLDAHVASNKTLANIQSVLRKSLSDAVDEELIEVNPLFGWRYKNKAAPKAEDDIDPFSVDEQARILEHLSGQGRNVIQFALWTGLRTSEYVALNWGDIDWERGVVTISKALTQHSSEAETPKTSAGNREVKLLPAALKALSQQKSFTWLKGAEVFQNPNTNERWTGDQPIRKTLWQHALKRAGVRYRKPYQTRHTYASMMLTAGEHPMWVASQMGHADWTMIARVYGRWMPDADPSAGSKAALLFAPSLDGLALLKTDS
jgi:integrase